MALLSLFVLFLGMYPQTVVPLTNPIHKALTDNYKNEGEDEYGNKVTKVTDGEGNAIYYTANRDNAGWSPTNQELNEVYLYDSEYYVKVTPYSYTAYDTSTNKHYTYNNGEPMERVAAGSETGDMGHLRWFKVEPIKWIILNFNQFILENEEHGIITDIPRLNKDIPLELYATDALIGGIPFGTSGHTSWEGSLINTYLNNEFYNQAFSSSDKLQIQTSTIYNNRKDNGTIYGETLPEYNSSLTYYPEGGQNETIQQIYLLSYYELTTSGSPYVGTGKVFAFGVGETESRQIEGTDYARAHNLYINGSRPYYWTRTAYSNAISNYVVNHPGGVGNTSTATNAYIGTRPALQLNEWLC